MNKYQTLKLRMYLTTQALLKNTTATSGLAGLPPKLTLLSAKIDDIHGLASVQTQPIEGRTAYRDELVTDMTHTSLVLADIVTAHASEHRLTELGLTVRVTPHDFEAARIIHRPWLAQRILDAAVPVLADLAPYGVTEATLADLRTKIAAVKANLDQPRSTIAEKRAATEEMADVFDQIDRLLIQIDKLVALLRPTNPEFCAEYAAARDLVGLPLRNDPAKPETTAPAALPAAAPSVTVTEQKAA